MVSKLIITQIVEYWELFLDLFFPRIKIQNLLTAQSLAKIHQSRALDLSPKYTALDTVIVASDYDLIKPILIRFKYHFEKHLAADLGLILYQKVAQKLELGELALPDFITFVPGDRKRVAVRGFNSPQLLAEILAQKLHIKCLPIFLKPKSTAAQAQQDRAKRLQNFDDQVFTLKDTEAELDLSVIRQVWLIDDVIATGTTVRHLSKLLKKRYPQIVVSIIALARTEA